MSRKEAYEQKLQAQLDQWRAGIERGWADLRDAVHDAAARFR